MRFNSWLVHDLPGLKPTCCLIGSVLWLVLFCHSFVEFVHMPQEGYWSVTLWNRRVLPRLSMTIILDCLHSVGILFSMKHLFIIVSSYLCALGPRLFSCSTRTSSLPKALLFFNIATPFLYSSLKGYIYH